MQSFWLIKLNHLRTFTMKHPLMLPALFSMFYFPMFDYLQNRVVAHFTIRCIVDQWVPFIPVFVIPYVCWFLLVPGMLIYLLLRDRNQYVELCFVLAICMTIALIVYFVFPNQIDLREHLPENNLMCAIIQFLRSSDPPCNVCPSIHVCNTVAVCLVASRSQAVTDHKLAWLGIKILGFLIVVSTTFIDQHSVIDILAGLILAFVAYFVVRRIVDKLDAYASLEYNEL